MEDEQGSARRQQRLLNELLRLTRENNRILRAERNMRRLRIAIILIIILGSTGYGYHILNKYRSTVVTTFDQIQELRSQVDEVVELGGQIKETAQNITNVIGGEGQGDEESEAISE